MSRKGWPVWASVLSLEGQSPGSWLRTIPLPLLNVPRLRRPRSTSTGGSAARVRAPAWRKHPGTERARGPRELLSWMFSLLPACRVTAAILRRVAEGCQTALDGSLCASTPVAPRSFRWRDSVFKCLRRASAQRAGGGALERYQEAPDTPHVLRAQACPDASARAGPVVSPPVPCSGLHLAVVGRMKPVEQAKRVRGVERPPAP